MHPTLPHPQRRLRPLLLVVAVVVVAASLSLLLSRETSGQTPTTGIRIQLEILSARLGLPDNPPNPSLAGFELEVSYPGTLAPLAQGFTDEDGVIEFPLAPGWYEIRQLEREMFVDLAKPSASFILEVFGDGTGFRDIPWGLRQDPSGPGNGGIVINVEPRGLLSETPDNPRNPNLYGYKFTVQLLGEPQSTEVLVTDPDGFGSLDLEPGDYYVEFTARNGMPVDSDGVSSAVFTVEFGQYAHYQWPDR